MTLELRDNASIDDLRHLVFSDHGHARDEFRRHFDVEIESALEALTSAHVAYRSLEGSAADTPLSHEIQLLVFSAFNHLLTSLHLLVSGMVTPSGNLMRQFGECVALALLMSSPKTGVYDRWIADREQYPVHDAISRLGRAKTLKQVGIKAPAWKRFAEIARFYDNFSHASALALSTQFQFSTPGRMAILGDFDPAQSVLYRAELTRRMGAAKVLALLTRFLLGKLTKGPEPSSASAAA